MVENMFLWIYQLEEFGQYEIVKKSKFFGLKYT